MAGVPKTCMARIAIAVRAIDPSSNGAREMPPNHQLPSCRWKWAR